MSTQSNSPEVESADTSNGVLRIEIRSYKWWLWCVLSVLLIASLFLGHPFRQAAMIVAVLQAAFWFAQHRSLMHFPTQVRVAYVIWMAASFVPVLSVLYWIQTAGTTALILFSYCPLARMLLLFPFNRDVPLTFGRVIKIFFTPPTNGSVLSDLKM